MGHLACSWRVAIVGMARCWASIAVTLHDLCLGVVIMQVVYWELRIKTVLRHSDGRVEYRIIALNCA